MTISAVELAIGIAQCALTVACFRAAVKVRRSALELRAAWQQLHDTVAGVADVTPHTRAGNNADRGQAAPAPSTARRLH